LASGSDDWRRIVLQAPEMQVATVTRESRERTQLVRARIDREQGAQGVDRQTWLKSLELKQRFVAVRSTQDAGFARVFELINKTNQFNTTGKRWTQAEFEELFARGGFCLTSSLRDKTADNGVIGIVIVRGAEIVQAVLSCRVFGLGAELAIGAIASRLALKSGQTALGRIVKTDKNLASREFFAKLGFQQNGADEGLFETGVAPVSPEWIEVAVDPGVEQLEKDLTQTVG
jgi:FkbH-like protein